MTDEPSDDRRFDGEFCTTVEGISCPYYKWRFCHKFRVRLCLIPPSEEVDDTYIPNRLYRCAACRKLKGEKE